jgi:hypothetical protein
MGHPLISDDDRNIRLILKKLESFRAILGLENLKLTTKRPVKELPIDSLIIDN